MSFWYTLSALVTHCEYYLCAIYCYVNFVQIDDTDQEMETKDQPL